MNARRDSLLIKMVPPELFPLPSRGAVRSARHPVTVEIVGSNPIERADTARYAIGKAAELKPL